MIGTAVADHATELPVYRVVDEGGLARGVWGADPSRALRVARQLRTGSIAINGSYPPFPLVPFGGFKESGLGRELGPEGLANFLEPRNIGLPAQLLPMDRLDE